MQTISANTPDARKRHSAAPRPPRAEATVWTPAEAAHFLGLTVQTLARKRLEGTGPRFLRPSPRIVRYRESECTRWLEGGGQVSSTAEADARDRQHSAA